MSSSPIVAQRLACQEPCSRTAPLECGHCGELFSVAQLGFPPFRRWTALLAPTLSSALWSVSRSLWHDWNVHHSVDEGKLYQTRSTSPVLSTICTVETCGDVVLAESCGTNGLRNHAVIAKWWHLLWTVFVRSASHPQPPLSGHPVYLGCQLGLTGVS